MPLEDMEIKHAVFADSGIREGFGKSAIWSNHTPNICGNVEVKFPGNGMTRAHVFLYLNLTDSAGLEFLGGKWIIWLRTDGMH
jgi:hypothetical protein